MYINTLKLQQISLITKFIDTYNSSNSGYITKEEMAAITSLNASTIMRNIEFMRDKYLRRVGSDKNGFWEIID